MTARRRVVTRVGGAFFALLSVAMFGLAAYFYTTGQPGNPSFADSRPDYGTHSSIELYLPSAAKVSYVSFQVFYRHLPDDPSKTAQDVTVSFTNEGSLDATIPIILKFEDGARADNFQRVETPGYPGLMGGPREYTSAQLITWNSPRGKDAEKNLQIRSTMRISALSTKNERTNLITPSVGAVRVCDSFKENEQFSLKDFDEDAWRSIANRCGPYLEKMDTRIEVTDLYNQAVRFDFSDPKPSDSITQGTWQAGNTAFGLRARASYVDLARDAQAQRFFFLSGIAIGLGSTCVPYGVQFVYRGFLQGRLSEFRRRNEETTE